MQPFTSGLGIPGRLALIFLEPGKGYADAQG